MNAEQLLAHYERIADAPDAIARLRRFILDLAVRGKLVSQDPKDEPALELLRRAKASKGREMIVRKIRKDSEPELSKSLGEETAPTHWVWAHLCDFALVLGGKRLPAGGSFSTENTGNIYIRVTDMKDGSISTEGLKYISDAIRAQIRKYTIERDDLYITIAGTIGNVGEVPELFHGQNLTENAAKIVFREMDKAFVRLVLCSQDVQEQFQEKTKQMAQPKLALKRIAGAHVPIPPFAEQQRIVAKVKELMALCDQLEKSLATREETRDRLTNASLARLNDPDPETFLADARFALDALPSMTARPDQIKQLRQTIQNLAVRGKLVPQNADDEPVAELLNRIADERADLVKQRVIRREDELTAINQDDVPFSIPPLWKWSRIGDVVLFSQYGTSQRAVVAETGVPVLTMGNIQNGLVVWGREKRIPKNAEDLPSLYLKRFDLLYNRTNSAELVGKTGIYLGDGDCRTFASYLIRLRPSLTSTEPSFLNLAMNAPDFRRTQIVPLIKKQTGQANVNGTALKNMLVPMPPLAEQRRIVAKVDALTMLCDQLEARLTEGETVRSRLLDALLHAALEPASARLEAAA